MRQHKPSWDEASISLSCDRRMLVLTPRIVKNVHSSLVAHQDQRLTALRQIANWVREEFFKTSGNVCGGSRSGLRTVTSTWSLFKTNQLVSESINVSDQFLNVRRMRRVQKLYRRCGDRLVPRWETRPGTTSHPFLLAFMQQHLRFPGKL